MLKTHDDFQASSDAVQALYRLQGLDLAVRDRLEALTGNRAEVGYLPTDDKAPWRSTHNTSSLEQRAPMFVTSTWRVRDPHNPDPNSPKSWLHAAGGVWVDIDAKDLTGALRAALVTRDKLQVLGVSPGVCSLFASGSKGFHVFVPLAVAGVDLDVNTVHAWPRLCRWFVTTALVTDSTDLGIYNGCRGRLIRQANVKRANGAYKVPMAWRELDGLTAEGYAKLCSEARTHIQAEVATLVPKAAAVWQEAKREVFKDLRKTLTARKPAPANSIKDRQRALDALAVIERGVTSGDVDYRQWLQVGAALKSTGWPDALQLWERVSAGHRGHRDRDCAARWDGLQGGCTLGSVFHIAKALKGGVR